MKEIKYKNKKLQRHSEKKKFCMTHAGAQTLLLFAALLLCVCAWFLGSTVGAK
jgi:hypothetical protein